MHIVVGTWLGLLTPWEVLPQLLKRCLRKTFPRISIILPSYEAITTMVIKSAMSMVGVAVSADLIRHYHCRKHYFITHCVYEGIHRIKAMECNIFWFFFREKIEAIIFPKATGLWRFVKKAADRVSYVF